VPRGPLRRRRLLRREHGAAGAQAPAGRHRRRQDRRGRRLQGRPPVPQPARLRTHVGGLRAAPGLVRLGDPAVQHGDVDGPSHPERPALVRPVRARHDRRAHARQDGRCAPQGEVGRRPSGDRLRRGPRWAPPGRERAGGRLGPRGIRPLPQGAVAPAGDGDPQRPRAPHQDLADAQGPSVGGRALGQGHGAPTPRQLHVHRQGRVPGRDLRRRAAGHRRRPHVQEGRRGARRRPVRPQRRRAQRARRRTASSTGTTSARPPTGGA
jgi:hypothetical protein